METQSSSLHLEDMRITTKGMFSHHSEFETIKNVFALYMGKKILKTHCFWPR